MPSINMITARRAERKRLEKLIRVALVVIFCEAVLVLLVFGFMATRLLTASWAIDRLDRKLEELEPTVTAMKEYESGLEELKPRLDLLELSKSETLLWYDVLRDLGWSMPESTWLNSLTAVKTQPEGSPEQSSQRPPPITTITLRGVTVSQRLVGEAMLRLNQFPEFQKVDLNYTQKGTDAELDTLEFQIAALLRPTEWQEGREVKQ